MMDDKEDNDVEADVTTTNPNVKKNKMFAKATVPVGERVAGSHQTVSGDALDTMALQLAFVVSYIYTTVL